MLRWLEIWNERTRGSMLRDAWKLLRRKIVRIDGNGNSRKAWVSLCQDLAKSAGMFLGLNERFQPLSLKRRMNAFRVYEQSQKFLAENPKHKLEQERRTDMAFEVESRHLEEVVVLVPKVLGTTGDI